MILWSLPPRWRYRVAIAMAKEFFKAHFFPEQYGRKAWLTNSLNYYLSALFFNAFPLPQREAGTRQTLRYIGALFAEGYSVLIFPEGKRTSDGAAQSLPGRHRDDRRPPGRSGRPGRHLGPGPGAAPDLEDGQARAGAGIRFGRAVAPRRATITPPWRNRWRTPSALLVQ